MSIKIEKKIVAYSSIDNEAFDPAYMSITREAVVDYIKNNPVPKDDNYTVGNIINDLTESSGMYCLPASTSQEMVDYIEEMLNYLIREY